MVNDELNEAVNKYCLKHLNFYSLQPLVIVFSLTRGGIKAGILEVVPIGCTDYGDSTTVRNLSTDDRPLNIYLEDLLELFEKYRQRELLYDNNFMINIPIPELSPLLKVKCLAEDYEHYVNSLPRPRPIR